MISSIICRLRRSTFFGPRGVRSGTRVSVHGYSVKWLVSNFVLRISSAVECVAKWCVDQLSRNALVPGTSLCGTCAWSNTTGTWGRQGRTTHRRRWRTRSATRRARLWIPHTETTTRRFSYFFRAVRLALSLFMFLCRRRGQMEATPEGAHFLSTVRHVPGCKRRMQSRLGISRVPFIEVRVLF